MLASSISICDLPVTQERSVRSLPSIDQLRLLNALGLRGLEAITYFRRCQERSPRPTIEALLRQLPIRGINT